MTVTTTTTEPQDQLDKARRLLQQADDYMDNYDTSSARECMSTLR